MKRDTAINLLLIIAGIVLAIALFGAGILWKSRATEGPKSYSGTHLVFFGKTWVGCRAVDT